MKTFEVIPLIYSFISGFRIHAKLKRMAFSKRELRCTMLTGEFLHSINRSHSSTTIWQNELDSEVLKNVANGEFNIISEARSGGIYSLKNFVAV